MKRAIFVFLLLAGALAPAQENPAKHLRLIALGEDPRNEEPLPYWHLRHDPDVASGLVIPRVTALVSGNQTVLFQMDLRVFTEVLPLDGSAEKLEVKSGEGKAAKNWVSARMPTTPVNLGVLFRDPDMMSWEHPKLLLLADDSKSFPPGTIRFVNVSDKTVLMKLGKTAFGIAPGKTAIKPIKEGVNPILVGYLEGNTQKEIWENQIKVLSKQRVQCFFYKAREPGKSGPVRFQLIPEAVPVLKSASP